MSGSEFELSEAPSSSSSGSDDDYVVSEQEEEPKPRPAPRPGPGRGAGAPRPCPAAAAPAAKRPRIGAQPQLPDLLRSASKEQLVKLVLQLDGESDGGLQDRVVALLPPPDLSGIKASIASLERKVEMAFPHNKWGSNRDNFAYKRVGPALRVKQQTAKALEGMLVKAVKAGAAPTAVERAAVAAELRELGLNLPVATKVLGAA